MNTEGLQQGPNHLLHLRKPDLTLPETSKQTCRVLESDSLDIRNQHKLESEKDYGDGELNHLMCQTWWWQSHGMGIYII